VYLTASRHWRSGPCPPSLFTGAVEGVFLGQVLQWNLSAGKSKKPCIFISLNPKGLSTPLAKVSNHPENHCGARKLLWVWLRLMDTDLPGQEVGAMSHDTEKKWGGKHQKSYCPNSVKGGDQLCMNTSRGARTEGCETRAHRISQSPVPWRHCKLLFMLPECQGQSVESYSHPILNKVAKNLQWRKESIFNNGAGKTE
jgi:hypothetical protein